MYRIEARRQTPTIPPPPESDAPSFRGGHDFHAMSGSGARSGEGIMFREFYFYVMSPIHTESSELANLFWLSDFPCRSVLTINTMMLRAVSGKCHVTGGKFTAN